MGRHFAFTGLRQQPRRSFNLIVVHALAVVSRLTLHSGTANFCRQWVVL